MRPQEVWVRDIKVGLRLVCIRAPPLAVPQVAAPEALATVSFPAPQGLKPNFPSNPTARLKPCPDTKPKTKPRVPLRSDSCEFRRIGSSATFMSHTLAGAVRASLSLLAVGYISCPAFCQCFCSCSPKGCFLPRPTRAKPVRSEERRVGKECRSRRSPYPEK